MDFEEEGNTQNGLIRSTPRMVQGHHKIVGSDSLKINSFKTNFPQIDYGDDKKKEVVLNEPEDDKFDLASEDDEQKNQESTE